MLRCFGFGAPREATSSETISQSVLRQSDLDAALVEAAAAVEPWSSSRWTLARELQDAAANFGRVQLMKDGAGGSRLTAVKTMPNKWVCRSSSEFNARHPKAQERPWLDVGLVRLLGSVRYPYVCRLHGLFRSGGETMVASAFCEEGDLYDWCFREAMPAPGPRREAIIRPIVADVVKAVRMLHDLGVAHRDLSLENFLIARTDAGPQVKLIDFGMATLRRTVKGEVRGKPSYQAPEVHTQAVVDTFLADAFALGVVVFAMALEDYPWQSTSRGSCRLFDYAASFGLRRFLRKRRLRNRRSGEVIADTLSPDLAEVIEALLQLKPRKRASLGELAFLNEERSSRRKGVWTMPYLEGARAAQAEKLDPVSGSVGPASPSASTRSPASGVSRASSGRMSLDHF